MTDAEIVRLLAGNVMGWTILPISSDNLLIMDEAGDPTKEWVRRFTWGPGRGQNSVQEWNPLTSISDAFQVVEKMRERRYTFSLQTSLTDTTVATKAAFSDSDAGEDFVKVDPITSRAICLAAIAAIVDGK